MLDIYLLGDSADTPEYPDELTHIGGISLDEHKTLSDVFNSAKSRGISFPYFEDSRLSSDQVLEMVTILDKHLSSPIKKDAKHEMILNKVRLMFSKAASNNVGVIAFCD